MTMSTKELANRILSDSYKIYSDVSKIDKAVVNSAATLGMSLQNVQMLEFDSKEIVFPREKKGILFHEGAKPEAAAKKGLFVGLFGGGRTGRASAPLQISNRTVVTPSLAKQPIIAIPEPERAAVGQTHIKLDASEAPTPVKQVRPKLTPLGTVIPAKSKITVSEPIKPEEVVTKMPASPVPMPKKLEPVAVKQQPINPAMIAATTVHVKEGKGERETSIDGIMPTDNPISKLLELVKSRGNITITDAAKEMNAPRDLVEKWSRILAQSLLIKLKYQLVGDVILEA